MVQSTIRYFLFLSILVFGLNLQAQTETTTTTNTETTETTTKDEGSSEQNTEAPTSSTNTAQPRVEKIQITGSLIRRSDVEGPSPVIVIDREKIEASGFNSVGQLLQASTASPFGGTETAINLRGIGSARTLVLMNGFRLPQSGSSFSTGSINATFVPLAAVERIEILKDGGSATYGSDALGGVVNIITRKNLDGFSLATKYDASNPIGGDRWRTALAWGKSTSKLNIMSSIQHIYGQHSVTSAQTNLQDLNDQFFFSANYRNDAGNIVAGPDCQLVDPQSGQCVEKRAFDQKNLDSHEFTSATDISYKVGSDTEIYATILGQYYTAANEFPAGIYVTPGSGGGVGIDLTAAETPAAWATSLPDYSGGDTTVYGVIKDLGPNKDTDELYVGGLVLGMKGYWGNSDWQWDVTTNNQINHAKSKAENAVLYAPFREKLIDGSYQPFDDGTNRDTTGITATLNTANRFVVNWLEAKTSGELANGLSSAFGVSTAHFAYQDDRDDRIVNQEVMGLTGSEGGGSRELYAIFMELNYAPFSNFETQLSLRNDNYSDFGSTVNPKLALRYQPTKWWMIRASAGTGFQAPLLQDVYGPSLNAFSFQVDRHRCATVGNNDPASPECGVRAFNALFGANPDLKEETSKNINFGMIFEPIQRLNFSFDYWFVQVDDTIGSDVDGLLEVEALNNGTVPSKYTSQINRDPVTGEIDNIIALTENVGNEEAHGLDVEINYTLKTNIGDFYMGTEHTYLFHYYESFYEELGRENALNQFDKPRWRNNTTVGYRLGDFAFRVVARTTDKTEKRVETAGFIPSFTQYDATFDWNAPWGAKFQLGAINIADEQPRADETQGAKFNRSLFRSFRTTFLSYRQDF